MNLQTIRYVLSELKNISSKRLHLFFIWIVVKSIAEAATVFSLYSVVFQLISSTPPQAISKVTRFIGVTISEFELVLMYLFVFVVSTSASLMASFFMNHYFGFLVHQMSKKAVMDKFGSGYMTERSINDVKDIIVETQNIVNGLFVPCIKTLAEALTIISISSILFLVSPKMAFYALLLLV